MVLRLIGIPRSARNDKVIINNHPRRGLKATFESGCILDCRAWLFPPKDCHSEPRRGEEPQIVIFFHQTAAGKKINCNFAVTFYQTAQVTKTVNIDFFLTVAIYFKRFSGSLVQRTRFKIFYVIRSEYFHLIASMKVLAILFYAK